MRSVVMMRKQGTLAVGVLPHLTGIPHCALACSLQQCGAPYAGGTDAAASCPAAPEVDGAAGRKLSSTDKDKQAGHKLSTAEEGDLPQQEGPKMLPEEAALIDAWVHRHQERERRQRLCLRFTADPASCLLVYSRRR